MAYSVYGVCRCNLCSLKRPLSGQSLKTAGIPARGLFLSPGHEQTLRSLLFTPHRDNGHLKKAKIGTRNMQNFSLLRMAGKARKPVMLKRGMSATIDEWLMAAEYLMEEGNHQVVLCERGVRTFARHSRNTLDLSAVPVVRKESHLPILIDPSHAAGRRDQVLPLSRASLVVGAHGIMVEVHHDPESALSDGAQSLYPEQFTVLQSQLQTIAQAFNSTMDKESR
ncbi:MAG: N-acetylneuraminate synthase family protein [Desulfovermiculus sp.]|nr:N-acetylneuraminate synthase family protein [Desulfovermiculus sp.]